MLQQPPLKKNLSLIKCLTKKRCKWQRTNQCHTPDNFDLFSYSFEVSSVGVGGMELWFISPVWLAVVGSDSPRAGGGFEWVGSYDGKAIFFLSLSQVAFTKFNSTQLRWRCILKLKCIWIYIQTFWARLGVNFQYWLPKTSKQLCKVAKIFFSHPQT